MSPEDDDSGTNSGHVISVGKHIELLKYVLDIFTGVEYGVDFLALPDYPDSRYADLAVNADSITESNNCSKGGTAVFTTNLVGLLNEGGWTFNFNDCEYDETVCDGSVERKNTRGGYLYLTS